MDDKVQEKITPPSAETVLHEWLLQEPEPLARTVKALAASCAAVRLLADSLRWCEPAALPMAISRSPDLARQALKEAQRLQGLAAHWVSLLQKAVNRGTEKPGL